VLFAGGDGGAHGSAVVVRTVRNGGGESRPAAPSLASMPMAFA
jgi:hypothetical protein